MSSEDKEEAVFQVKVVKVKHTDFMAHCWQAAPRKVPFDDENELFSPPHENPAESNTPRLNECRFAALPLGEGRYVVYDRMLSRIVDGVYNGGESAKHNALEVAELYNEGRGNPDMSPSGDALGLYYPPTRKGTHE